VRLVVSAASSAASSGLRRRHSHRTPEAIATAIADQVAQCVKTWCTV
jgi:hypothetical protein